MFYATSCIFSRRVASYVYAIAQLFPQLRVYAVNVHENSSAMDRLINYHGVAGAILHINSFFLREKNQSAFFSNARIASF